MPGSYFVEVGCHRGSKPHVFRRAILNGQDFVKRFNTYRQQASTWNNIYVQTNGCPGSLFGFRLSDRTNLQNDLQVVVDGDAFTFLCANGNYFLFSRVQPGEMPVLIVLNITSRKPLLILAASNTLSMWEGGFLKWSKLTNIVTYKGIKDAHEFLGALESYSERGSIKILVILSSIDVFVVMK
nr:protein chromatin remodeling 4 [Tanacetum cinerariifolium]GEY26513.1 protein chromatin remodeling 4 [Tanacetum cinerariifolium]